jgi:hypothetical protein
MADRGARRASPIPGPTPGTLARNVDEHRLAEFVEKVYATA